MKVAIPWDGNKVFQHYGKSRIFAVFSVDEGEVRDLGMLDTEGSGGHEALAALLAEEEIDVLICGGIGAPARDRLAAAGIECVSGVEGWISDVIEAYAAGTLESDPGSVCAHHAGGAHDCEHTCH